LSAELTKTHSFRLIFPTELVDYRLVIKEVFLKGF